MAIAIITDTDSSLPDELAAAAGIYHVPISIHFGDEILKSNQEIDDAGLVARIEQDGKLPTTSAPSPGDFVEVYTQAFADGADEILCITVSGEVSATYKAALAARDMLPEKKITVVDSWSVSIGQGFMALRAVQLASREMESEEIVKDILALRERIKLFAALDTLKYMAMSGRVGSISAEMAKMLNIKPILTIQEGKLDLLEKVRTRKKAWNRLVDLAADAAQGQPVEEIFLIHVDAEEELSQFEELLRTKMDCPEEIPVAGLSPGLSVHTGPGLIGLAFLRQE